MSLTEQQTTELEKARKTHPHAEVIECGSDWIVGRPPTRAEWKRFMSYNRDDKKKDDAFEVLLFDCRIFPEAAALESLLDLKPGLIESFGKILTEMAGLTGGAEVKK
jgi:hypothetical protein